MFELYPFLVYNILFLLATVFCELMYRYLHIQAFFTRKLAHALTGGISASFAFFIESPLTVAGISALFLFILWFSKQKSLLHSINKVEGETWGSVIYPVVIWLVFFVYTFSGNKTFYTAVILVLAFCDPAAAVSGKLTENSGRKLIKFGRGGKTLAGSLVFFIFSLIIQAIVFTLMPIENFDKLQTAGIVLTGALISTLSEAYTTKGFDNFTVPFGLFAWYYFCLI